MSDAPLSEKLNCKQVSRILSDGLDAELPVALRARLQAHMAICAACRGFEQQMAQLRRVMRGMTIDARDGDDERRERDD